ncbi:MAG TPA: YfiR family protein [Anaeromyxobacteraceae bacterium]
MALVVAAAFAAPPAGAAPRPGEYEVKAAMLLNVAKFVEWPAGARGAPSSELRVCALGAPRFAAALATAATRTGSPVTVWEVRSPSEARGCAIAILGADVSEGVEELAAGLAAAGVFTVSEGDGLAARGVLLSFVFEGERVRFEINLEAAHRASFRFSSKLLKLARLVGTSP